MKIETIIFDNLKRIIPKNARKTVLYANVTDTSYELFFYCLLEEGIFKQCYNLAEEGVLDSYLLDTIFDKIANQIRTDKNYQKDNYNVFTVIVDNYGVKLDVNNYIKSTRLYKIKKEWREKYLV